MARTVIFLDIDGVLVERFRQPAPTDEWTCCSLFNGEAVLLLREVTERNRAELVISSTWRMFGMDVISARLTQAGWPNPPIIGFTPDLSGNNSNSRGNEIQVWLNENSVETFVIVDDDDDMLSEQMPRFVRCNREQGFTSREVEAVNQVLNTRL